MRFLSKYLKYILPLSMVILLIALALRFGIFKQNIRFESNIDDLEFELYQDNFSVKFTTPFDIKLNSGEYYVRALNQEKYTPLAQKLIISKNQNFKLNFDLNDQYSSNKFQDDISKIHNLIKTTYPQTIKNNFYTIDPGKFFKDSQYYATAIGLKSTYIISESTQSDEDNNTSNVVESNEEIFFGNVYFVIFEKKDNTWQQITHPELIFSRLDYPKIPPEILQEVNMWR